MPVCANQTLCPGVCVAPKGGSTEFKWNMARELERAGVGLLFEDDCPKRVHCARFPWPATAGARCRRAPPGGSPAFGLSGWNAPNSALSGPRLRAECELCHGCADHHRAPRPHGQPALAQAERHVRRAALDAGARAAFGGVPALAHVADRRAGLERQRATGGRSRSAHDRRAYAGVLHTEAEGARRDVGSSGHGAVWVCPVPFVAASAMCGRSLWLARAFLDYSFTKFSINNNDVLTKRCCCPGIVLQCSSIRLA